MPGLLTSVAASAPVGRASLDLEARRNLLALEAIDEDSRITQRTLAGRLGIALGLTNLYLKRLVRKGYVKRVNAEANRLRYLLTSKGSLEKARLTYEFMESSLALYRQVRAHWRATLEPYTRGGRRRVAVYGTGEAAELAYLSIAELGLDCVAVFDRVGGGRFLGRRVRAIAAHRQIAFDLLIVATLERPGSATDRLRHLGIGRERLVALGP